MNVALRPRWTLERFLEWEARQEYKWEFDGVEPVARAGGTAAHAAIQRNLIAALTRRLAGSRCSPYGSELKVVTGEGTGRYPDAFVVCTPVDPRATVITDPVVIFEVLSDGTQATDRDDKNREYRATPSVQRYVMLEQDRIMATVFTREDDDWIGRIHRAGAVLAMPEIGIEIPLTELYAGLDFPTPGESVQTAP